MPFQFNICAEKIHDFAKLNRTFVSPFGVNMGCTEGGTFSVAFSGNVICQRDLLSEGVTSEKYLEPGVGCEYRAGKAAAKNMVQGREKTGKMTSMSTV